MKRTLCILVGAVAVLTAAGACHADERDPQRARLIEMLGIPARGGNPHAEHRGDIEHDGLVIEKWVFTAEPGSRVPALLYRPAHPPGRMPAIVITHGHGGSKSRWSAQYVGQLYAKLGLAVLVIDPIGEEERHITGKMGSRAHDDAKADARAAAAGRLIMGKLLFDTMRGIDWLLTRGDIDTEHIGVAGSSMGGAQATWMAALEGRIRLAIVGAWAYDDAVLPTKLCQRVPFTKMRETMDWPAFIGLAAPRCAILLAGGDADSVIDMGDPLVWRRTRENFRAAADAWHGPGEWPLMIYLEPAGGHRPYFLYREAVAWVHVHLGTPAASAAEIQNLPAVNAGAWCDLHHVPLEKATGTDLHVRGATLVDMNIQPLSPETLAVLRPEEKGSPDYTIEGWLDQIEGKRPRN